MTPQSRREMKSDILMTEQLQKAKIIRINTECYYSNYSPNEESQKN